MHRTYSVELISTGSELLSGKTVNTHGHVIGQALHEMGLELARDTTILDNFETIKSVTLAAMDRSDVVFVSGGLGPTSDDITRDVFASIFQDRLVHDPKAIKRIRHFFEGNGREMTELGARQALVLETAEVLDNRVGAAPGEWLCRDEVIIILLPGPPAEMYSVLMEEALPRLKERLNDLNPRPEALFQVCMGESDIAAALVDVEEMDAVDVAYCASERWVEVRINVDEPELLSSVAAVVRRCLGTHIFSEKRETMEDVVGHLLIKKGKTLATAESCTGGLLGDRITDIAGSSAYYVGGVIAYSNAVKEKVLGVPSYLLERVGAVSPEVARHMAMGVRECLQADFGIGITGIAGPGGGTKEKPVGLVHLAIADAEGCTSYQGQFGALRTRNKKLATQVIMNELRLKLLEI